MKRSYQVQGHTFNMKQSKDYKTATPPRVVLPTRVMHPDGSEGTHWSAQSPLEWLQELAHQMEGLNQQNSTSPVTGGSPPSLLAPKDHTPHTLLQSTLALQDETLLHEPRIWTRLTWYYERDSQSWYAFQHMACLANLVERLDDLPIAEYSAIQDHFASVMNRVLTQRERFEGETRQTLNAHYLQTIDKLKAILNSRRSFTEYMTAWLLDNWINPYPDNDNLVLMAQECKSTPQVVNNWLINARTRKWRPALVKATALHRPSQMLLEDSMRIFQGKPIRSLGLPAEVPHHIPSFDDPSVDYR